MTGIPRGTLALAVAALFHLVASSVAVFAKDDVTVSLVAPLSGNYIAAGTDARQGVSLAVELLNAGGGLLGRPLRLAVFDDGCDSDLAEAAAIRAIDEQPKVIIGHTCSGGSIRAAPIYAAAGVIQISPFSTNPRLTEMGIPTLFRIIGRDDKQSIAAARLIANRWPNQRVGVIDDGGVFGLGLANLVREELGKRNIPISLNKAFSQGQNDYASLITSLREQQISVLFIGGYGSDAGVIAREIAGARLPIQIIGGDDLISNDFLLVAESAAEGVMFSHPPDPTRAPFAASLMKLAADKGIALHGRAILAYAAVQAWAEAVRRAGTFSAAPIAGVLRGAPMDTVVGPVSFDANGDVLGPAGDWVWFRWRSGQPEQLDP